METDTRRGTRFDPDHVLYRMKPCTRETARCADAKSYHTDLRPCCRALIVEVMDHFIGVAEELGLRWWADYGTLLGAVRNGGIIPHDKDADIGIMGDDWSKLLAYRSDIPWKKAGGSFRPTHTREVDGFEWVLKEPREAKTTARYEFTGGHLIKIRASKWNHTNLDIFPWYLHHGQYERRRYISADRYKGRAFPPERLLPLSTVEWEGRTIPAPADPAWMCQHRYGPNWKNPLRANNDGIRR